MSAAKPVPIAAASAVLTIPTATATATKPIVIPAPGATAAPAAATAPTPAPAAATPAQEDPIRRVAVFCAARGVQMIRDLQAKAETRTVMPFLFVGHPEHPRFLAELKEALLQRQQQEPGAGAAAPVAAHK